MLQASLRSLWKLLSSNSRIPTFFSIDVTKWVHSLKSQGLFFLFEGRSCAYQHLSMIKFCIICIVFLLTLCIR